MHRVLGQEQLKADEGISVQESRILKLFVALILCGSITACSPVFQDHGYVPEQNELDELAIGLDTKDSIAVSLGTPQSSGVLRDEGWYYISSTFQHLAYNAPKEVSREVVALSFDDLGVLSNVERFGLDDGRVIALNRRVTELPIKAPGFLQSLFSDFGRFSLSDFTNN
jgi:outer membrane protein assembly factor BamE (lipoprotein component of BamABCDE complex)